MSRLKNLDDIQDLVKELQSSRNEILRENEKLAGEIVKLNREINEVNSSKKELQNENEELATEVIKLNEKVEEYKNLYTMDNLAKENLQKVIKNSQKEIDKLEETLKVKDEVLNKLKEDYGTFMDEVCDENKKLKNTIDCREKEYLKMDKLKEQNDCYKNCIDNLEKEVRNCLNKICCLQETINCRDKQIEELNLEIKKLEKRIAMLTDNLDLASAALEKVTEENKKLKDIADQRKQVLCRCEKCKSELMIEIQKFDKLTCTMEKQLKDNQACIQQLEECLKKERCAKRKLQAEIEKLTEMLTEEKCLRVRLENELTVEKKARKCCEIRLKKACMKIKEISEEFRCYKENIHKLKHQIQERASYSCPPIRKIKSSCKKLDTKIPSFHRSCQLLYCNTKGLKSFQSCRAIPLPPSCRAGTQLRTVSKICTSSKRGRPGIFKGKGNNQERKANPQSRKKVPPRA